MHSLILIFLLAVGGNDAVFRQRLTCPYGPKHQNLLRVWCRQSSAECCMGLTFSNSSHSADGGKLRVTQDMHSFTVEVLEPSHQEGGVYWCGLLSKNDTIIKLAEGYFHSSSSAFVWSFTRWIMLPLLPIVTIFTYVCITSRKMSVVKSSTSEAESLLHSSLSEDVKTSQCSGKEDEPYDDVATGRALTVPDYESPDSPNEWESSGI